LQLKLQKIEIYKSKADYISILRTIDKMLTFFNKLKSCPEDEKLRIVQMLHRIQYETLFRQGNPFKACQILYDNFINVKTASEEDLI